MAFVLHRGDSDGFGSFRWHPLIGPWCHCWLVGVAFGVGGSRTKSKGVNFALFCATWIVSQSCHSMGTSPLVAPIKSIFYHNGRRTYVRTEDGQKLCRVRIFFLTVEANAFPIGNKRSTHLTPRLILITLWMFLGSKSFVSNVHLGLIYLELAMVPHSSNKKLLDWSHNSMNLWKRIQNLRLKWNSLFY